MNGRHRDEANSAIFDRFFAKHLCNAACFLLPSIAYNGVLAYSRDVLIAEAVLVVVLCYMPRLQTALAAPPPFDLLYMQHVRGFPKQVRLGLMIVSMGAIAGFVGGLLLSRAPLHALGGCVLSPAISRTSHPGKKAGMLAYCGVLTLLSAARSIALPRYQLGLTGCWKQSRVIRLIDFLFFAANDAALVTLLVIRTGLWGILAGALLLGTHLTAVLMRHHRGVVVCISVLLARYLATLSSVAACVWLHPKPTEFLFASDNLWTRVARPL